MKKLELYDKVKIKSKNAEGFIVDILSNGKYVIEKSGNQGPLYFDIDKDDLEFIRR